MKGRAASAPELSVKNAAPWLLIAFSPVIFALLTSDPSNPGTVIRNWLRLYGLPIAGVEIGVIGLAVWSGCRPISSLQVAPRWTWFILAALLGIAAGATLIAVEPNLALLHFLLWLVHLLFGLSVACLAQSVPEKVRSLFWPAVVVGLIAFALLLALYVALIPDPKDFYWLRFGFAVSNIRHVGFFAIVGIAASLGIALTERRIGPTIAASGAASVFYALAFWSGSRGAPVASLVALLSSLVLFKCLRTSRSAAITVACSVVGLILSRLHRVPDKHFGLERISQFTEKGTLDGVTSGRIEVWRATWEAVLDRPLFGHGQGQFALVVPEARPLHINHPHNSILQIAFDWGFLGASCLAVMLLYLCFHCLKVIGDDPKSEVPAFLVGAALITSSLYDGALFFAYPIMMFVVALAWIAGTGRSDSFHDMRGTPRREPTFT